MIYLFSEELANGSAYLSLSLSVAFAGYSDDLLFRQIETDWWR